MARIPFARADVRPAPRPGPAASAALLLVLAVARCGGSAFEDSPGTGGSSSSSAGRSSAGTSGGGGSSSAASSSAAAGSPAGAPGGAGTSSSGTAGSLGSSSAGGGASPAGAAGAGGCSCSIPLVCTAGGSCCLPSANPAACTCGQTVPDGCGKTVACTGCFPGTLCEEGTCQIPGSPGGAAGAAAGGGAGLEAGSAGSSSGAAGSSSGGAAGSGGQPGDSCDTATGLAACDCPSGDVGAAACAPDGTLTSPCRCGAMVPCATVADCASYSCQKGAVVAVEAGPPFFLLLTDGFEVSCSNTSAGQACLCECPAPPGCDSTETLAAACGSSDCHP